MINKKLDLKDTRVVLDPNFKKELFIALLKKYSRHTLSRELDISSPMIYHYKNNRVNNLSLLQFNKCLELAGIDKKDTPQFVKRTFSRQEEISDSINKGKRARYEQLKLFRRNIPSVEEIIQNNALDVKKWFDSYKILMTSGYHKIIDYKNIGNLLLIEHLNYVKGKKERFIVQLPARIKMDDTFCYFFGLWCGDRAGGGRVGVANKEKVINEFTEYYLHRLYQNPRTIILKSSRIKELPPNLNFDGIQEVKNMPGTYVPVVFAVNGILKQFFFYLDKQLHTFLPLLPNIKAFFAGLFDAEGNILPEDNCFRWACKDQRKIEIYTTHLKKMNLFRRYDGACLICLNKDDFGRLILPYLKHPQKINDTKLVCFGEGQLNRRFLNILKIIQENNGSSVKILAKSLKRGKLHAQIRVLERLGYVESRGYPKMIFMTKNGMASLSHGGKDQ